MNKLMIISRQQATYTALLAQQGLPDLTLTDDPAEANVILADPPLIAHTLERFSALAWLQSTFAGIDALIQPDKRQDYQLTNIRGCFGQLITEYVLGYSASHYRHFSQYQRQQADAQWQPHSYRGLAGRVMVILGTGSIGQHLAHAATALGLRAIGVNRSGTAPSESPDAFETIYPISRLADTLPQADIVVSTLPATTATNDLLNRDSLQHCREALLFNVGRGNAVCEESLLWALTHNHLAHAVLDVFKQEPLPAAHPFWHHPQITVTPHIAAESFPDQVMAIFADNYRRWHTGSPLCYQIDFQRGY